MTFEEMMQAVDTFRSWPIELQQYCVKIGGYRNLQTDELQKKPCALKKGTLRNHGLPWTETDRLELKQAVESSGGPCKRTYEKLASRFGRTWHSLKNEYEKITGVR